MPSWVVPAVAAELWGVSVEHVLADAAEGRVRSRKVGSFLFVDIERATDAAQAPPAAPMYRRSLAWASTVAQPVISSAERDALLDDGEVGQQKELANAQETSPEASLLTDEQPDWKKVRARVASLRRPPNSRDAA